MNVTSEQLAAYADGELGEFEAAQVRRAIEADPMLSAELKQLQDLRGLLSEHYDPILASPLPDRLTAPIEAAGSVIDLSSAREDRRRWFERPALRVALGSAIAACLVLTLVMGRGGRESGYAEPQLAAVLDNAFSGEVASDGTRVLLSFRNHSGEVCRAWTGSARSGISCRDAKGWELRLQGQAGQPAGSEYRQASSGDAAIMAAAQDMATGPAFDAAEEAAARSKGWVYQ